MTLEEAKTWLGVRWVLHPEYEPQPQHRLHELVNVVATWNKARERMRQERSFIDEVAQVRQKLRLVHGRVA